jgi:hypothetical protein
MRLGILIVAIVAAGLGRAHAQVAHLNPPAGSRVRVLVSHDLDRLGEPVGVLSEFTGIVHRHVRDSLVITVSGRDTVVAIAYVFQMEVADGTKTRALPVAIGLAVPGALVGLLASSLAACPLLNPCHNQAGYAVAGVLAGGLAGAAVGGVIGLFFHTDRWVDVPANTFKMTLVPARSGASARLAASF